MIIVFSETVAELHEFNIQFISVQRAVLYLQKVYELLSLFILVLVRA